MNSAAQAFWPFTINEFSDEIIMMIFGRLGGGDVCQAAQVCRRWHRISRDNALWRRLFLQKHNFKPDNKIARDWRKLYQSVNSSPESFKAIQDLFFDQPLDNPRPIRVPYIDITDGKLISFPGSRHLLGNINYLVDELGRRFIYIKIEDERSKKMISIQQKFSQSGDWYVFCIGGVKGFHFVVRDKSYVNCGALLSNGKLVDPKIYKYLQTLLRHKILKISLEHENVIYRLA
jgi:hypothetical protein